MLPMYPTQLSGLTENYWERTKRSHKLFAPGTSGADTKRLALLMSAMAAAGPRSQGLLTSITE